MIENCVFRSKSNDGNVVVNVVLHTVRLETYVMALCRDGNLRVWCGGTGQCIGVHDVLSEPQGRGKELLQGEFEKRIFATCNFVIISITFIFFNFKKFAKMLLNFSIFCLFAAFISKIAHYTYILKIVLKIFAFL